MHYLVLEGIGLISQLITDNLESVVKLYLFNQPPEVIEMKTMYALKERLINLYAAALKYLLLARYYYEKGSWGSYLLKLVQNPTDTSSRKSWYES